ncbi:hypothetical protein F5Y15DRAFT_258176 [Xylariaceae sp. FL0016]|nr:hypothetical protein F5Y15DRAFT_258176 [Xylariaceae sp. FL0016]
MRWLLVLLLPAPIQCLRSYVLQGKPPWDSIHNGVGWGHQWYSTLMPDHYHPASLPTPACLPVRSPPEGQRHQITRLSVANSHTAIRPPAQACHTHDRGSHRRARTFASFLVPCNRRLAYSVQEQQAPKVHPLRLRNTEPSDSSTAGRSCL